MATVALTKNEVLASVPFLIRKLTMTGGTTSLAVTHGEDREPDLILSQCLTESATVTTVLVVRTSATVVTVDTLGNAGDAVEVYLIWTSQASGGISS